MKTESFRECMDASRLAIEKTNAILSRLQPAEMLSPKFLMHSGLRRRDGQNQFWEIVSDGYLFRLPVDLAAGLEKLCEETRVEVLSWFEHLSQTDRSRCECLLM